MPVPARFRFRLGIAAIATLISAFPAPARAYQVQPSLALPPYPYRAKEFCVTRLGNVFHLFYTRDDVTASFTNSTKDLGHFVSYDLNHWSELAPVLPVRDDNWDNSHVWAPHIVATDSLYYMFYCGVTRIPGSVDEFQQIGLATSTDLMNWNRLDAPVFTCHQTNWTYCDPSVAPGGNFRDPWVMPDPDSTGRWLLLYAGGADSVTGQMELGIATSSGDFTQWIDHGPLVNTAWATSFSYLIESPLPLYHDGLWYLFYTTDSGHPINYQTTPDLLAPPEQWGPQRRFAWEVDGTDDIYGPEGYTIGSQTFFGAADEVTGAALLWEMVFDDAPHFHVVSPGVAGVTPAPSPMTLALDAAPRPDRDGNVRFVVTAPSATRGRLTLYDLQGRALVTLHDGALAQGVNGFSWHADARSGMYFARLDTPLGHRNARVFVTR